MKRCARCETVKPRSAFHRSALRADGLQVYCIDCRAEIDHARYERRVGKTVPRCPRNSRRETGPSRRAWLLNLKVGRPCTDCGRTFPPEAMQWDHLPGFEKASDVSSMWGRSTEEMLRELAKCELVCANCHAIRTFRRSGWADKWTIREAERTYGVEWTAAA